MKKQLMFFDIAWFFVGLAIILGMIPGSIMAIVIYGYLFWPFIKYENTNGNETNMIRWFKCCFLPEKS